MIESLINSYAKDKNPAILEVEWKRLYSQFTDHILK